LISRNFYRQLTRHFLSYDKISLRDVNTFAVSGLDEAVASSASSVGRDAKRRHMRAVSDPYSYGMLIFHIRSATGMCRTWFHLLAQQPTDEQVSNCLVGAGMSPKL
jgi:hypothetical protein